MTGFLRRLDFSKSIRILVVAFLASLLVTGIASLGAGSIGWVDAIWQSLSIAVLVAAGTACLRAWRASSDTQSGAVAGGLRESGAGPARYASGGSLEKNGITTKLLELIALGDRYGNVFSLALISIDHLDELLEQYQDSVTNRLLDKVSEALAHTLRMPDRMGEFDRGTYLVVLPETNLPGAIQIAERLREAVTDLDVAVSRRLHIHTTASVAVTSYRRGDDIKGMLERADRTLREAQKQGRNRVLPDLAA